MSTKQPALIVIVGETASGKSALALEIAQMVNGELLCADATTVYREFTIGTAKPSLAEQKLVAHHLLDVTSAPQGYSAPQFKREAVGLIEDISRRGKVPIMVGGTGLYIDSVLYDYGFLQQSEPSERAQLESMTLAELVTYAKHVNLPVEQVDTRNKRRVIRLIENNGKMPSRSALRPDTLVLGVSLPRELLEKRIQQRVNAMIDLGLEAEAKALSDKYGWSAEPMKAIGYREWQEYFNGTQTLELTIERIISGTKRLAKKQRTWFKRNNSIHWVSNRDEAVATTTTFLNKYRSD